MDPSTINPDDALKLIEQVFSAVASKNYLLAVPLVVLALIAAFRKWIVPLSSKLAWFSSDRGGGLRALLGALATSIIASTTTDGPHTAAQVISAAMVFLVSNQALFGFMKKLIAPSGPVLVNEVATQADAAGAAVTADAQASAQAAADALNSVGK